MILKFNPKLFTCDDNEIYHSLSKILLEVLEDRFLWDLDNLDDIFLADNNFFDLDFSIDFLSNVDRKEIEEKIGEIYHKSTYITSEQKKYLTEIVVGIDDKEISPVNAYKILTKPSLIILENHINDFKFIESIVSKYANHSQRKSIYKLVEKAIQKEWLISENAGGFGGIVNTVENHIVNRYSNIYFYKLFTLFDSDRNNNSEFDVNKKNLINYLKNSNKEQIELIDTICDMPNDKIYWHILYKREMENYLPLEIIKDLALTAINIQELDAKTPNELDFIDYDNFLSDIDVKQEFPNSFKKQWTRDKIEKRCEHHKIRIELPNRTEEEVSEIEQILLKIAKII